MTEKKKEIQNLKNIFKFTVDGVEYTQQKLPPRQALELREQWHINGQPNEVKMFDMVLEHMIIHPKVTLDDFEDVIVVEKVVGEALKNQYRTKGKQVVHI